MSRKLIGVLILGILLSSLLLVLPAGANPPAPDEVGGPVKPLDLTSKAAVKPVKPLDQPNPLDKARLEKRWKLLEAGNLAEAQALDQVGTDRVLVILVEFAGTDTLTWNPGDQWDPLGRADPNEAVYDEDGNLVVGDCSNIITQTTTFTYSGPAHNQIPRPLSESDRSGQSIWTEDFSPDWFNSFMFGNGIKFQYTRQDGSVVNEDRTGMSVRNYFLDFSDDRYDIHGDVIGWLPLPHSEWWYGADKCPGNRSGMSSGAGSDSAIPGAGTTKSLVRDALDAVNAISNTVPGFDWKNYDLNGDGVIDRLWIVHSGYGEEDGDVLLNRTDYGEAAVWSHSSAVANYPVSPEVVAGPYIIMPENGGIGVFAHEYAHNLGADDLYTYGYGNTSTGFWALQSDDWTGYPIGYQPPSPDPWHLDRWGWLNPLVVDDPSQEYVVKIGQASNFPNQPDMVRGVKITLPDGRIPLAVQPLGSYEWWGGKADETNSMMTLKNPIAIPAGGATLEFSLAYGIETAWDFLWVQASDDGGATWKTLTNANTQCVHDPDWIGEQNGFPEDLCGAGLGGFTDYNASFPDFDTETFDLAAFAGKNVLLRFWYMTDWATTYEGPFVDNVKVTSGSATLFSDDAEAGDANWTYAEGWVRTNGTKTFTHNYYLQWRNVNENGGYDSALGDARWRFGPANTGLLVWYNNNAYTDNEIFNYLFDYPGFGPKGRMLVVDSHPEPYRDPDMVAMGYNNEGGNLTSRGQMRDAPFTLQDTVSFTETDPYREGAQAHSYSGRPAVSIFNDALGYYPGAEYVVRGPAYPPTQFKWVTKQWDASVNIPSLAFYGIKAPGYTANEEFRWDCTPYLSGPYTGYLGCYWLGAATGLGYDGGTGNPGDSFVNGSSGAYGWRVELIEEAPDHTWGKVRIYNRQVKQMNIVPDPNKVGYVDSRNRLGNYLGSSHMYGGLDTRPQTPRILYPTFQFDLSDLPAGAKILGAKVSLMGQNDTYLNARGDGLWHLQLLDSGVDFGPMRYWDIHNASVVATIPPALMDLDLAPGTTNTFTFSEDQIQALQNRFDTTGRATFRVHAVLNRPYGRNIFDWHGAGDMTPVLWVQYED
jgi:immune inhibitor A